MKNNIIISSRLIEIDGYTWYKDFKTLENCGVTSLNKVFVLGEENLNKFDSVLSAITLLTKAEKVVFVLYPESDMTNILSKLGFEVSETYDDYSLISTEKDLELIEKTCISICREKVKISLEDALDNIVGAYKDIIKLVKGEKGYFELNDNVLSMGMYADTVKDVLKKYIDEYVFSNNTQLNAFIRYLGKTIGELDDENQNLKSENSRLLSKYNASIEQEKVLKNELDLLKSVVKFNHFIPYEVNKTNTDIKVIYVREYSHCPFLTSFLLSFRIFLMNSNIKNVFAIVKQKSELSVDNECTLNSKNIETINVETLYKEACIKIEEPSPAIWNFLFNKTDIKVAIVLDKMHKKDPTLVVKPQSGVSLSAVGSARDIIEHELDLEYTITSVDSSRKTRFVIPVRPCKSDMTAMEKSIWYINTCNKFYTEICRKAKVRGTR